MTGVEDMSDADRLINILLSPSVERSTFSTMADWFTDFNQQTRACSKAVDRAILGGRLSLNVSFAFTSGYQSAIEALFKAKKIQLSSFCVTEEKGNHPRALETRLFQESGKILLSGNKKFVSGAHDAECLYIVCRDEREGSGLDDSGLPILKLVSVPANSVGVRIQTMPALGFVPEVSHGKVLLDRVAIDAEQICEGDGYLRYVKGFRSFEDLHVLAAITGYRLGEAIAGQWPKECVENHIALLLAQRSLSNMDLNKPSAHIGLAACRSQFQELISDTNRLLESSNPQAFCLWQRDKALLDIAKAAHQKRTQSAWERF